MEKMRSIISRWISGTLIKELLLGGNFSGHHLARDFDGGPLGMKVADDVLSEGKDGLLMALLVLVDVDGRNSKRGVMFCGNFVVGDVFVVLFDVDHQHVEME